MFYYPMGIHAARDMARLCGLFAGDLRCLLRAPALDFEKIPGGKIWLKSGGNGTKYCLGKMRIWGYFVEPSKYETLPVRETGKMLPRELKVLWVGRLLNWKRVDTIVRAVCEHANLKRADNPLPKMTLDIYGMGTEKSHLKKLSSGHGDIINFHPAVPIEEVRRQMRLHDIYVMSSNEHEGWGAVVNEALEEGMRVVGTCAAGSCATMFSPNNLFMVGDWRALSHMVRNGLGQVGIGDWTPRFAAALICNEIRK